MTEPQSTPGVFASRRRKPSRAPLLLFLILAAAVVGGLYLLSRAKLAFSNGLAGPVRLSLPHEPPLTLAPGESVRVPLPWGRNVIATWALVRPLSADGKPMGEDVRESVLLEGRWTTISRRARARSNAGDFFAPLITNASDEPLRVTVNAGLEGSLDCGCAVRPGARRTFVGYYRLFENSTVQGAARGQRSALFRNLGSQVLAADGTVGLRFDSADLRAP